MYGADIHTTIQVADRANTACLPLPLHFPMAEDKTSVPSGQSGLGIPEVWSLKWDGMWSKQWLAPRGQVAVVEHGHGDFYPEALES
jgi:hypothetical protein